MIMTAMSATAIVRARAKPDPVSKRTMPTTTHASKMINSTKNKRRLFDQLSTLRA